jgi:formylglycine-generating enzyme required for sulfatase activity
MDSWAAVSSPGVKPQGHIDQVGSARACHNAGKRLCSVDEWRAAFGGNKYPYGDAFREGACNAGLVKTHPLVHFFPDTPHEKRPGSQYNDERILEYVGLNAGGAFKDCVSPLGIFDLGGNLSEWLDLIIEKKGKTVHRLSEVLDRIDDFLNRKNETTLRGYFAGNRMVDEGTGGVWYWTNAHEPEYYDYSTGFRCCLDR